MMEKKDWPPVPSAGRPAAPSPPRPPARRVRRLCIAPEFLMHLTSGKFEVIASPVPKDAKLTQSTIDAMNGVIQLFIASEEFDEVELGSIPPIHEPPFIRRVEG